MLAELPHHAHVLRHLLSVRSGAAMTWTRVESLFGSLGGGLAGGVAPGAWTGRIQPILVADFDARNGDWCASALSALSHEVSLARDAGEVSVQLRASPWLLAFAGGLEHSGFAAFLERIRWHAWSVRLPILVVGDSERYEAEALLQGADEYLALPISAQRMSARLAALQRRCGGHGGSALRADPGSRRAWAKGSELRLPPALFSLLTAFLANPGRVLSSDYLAAAIGSQQTIQRDAIKAYVHKLRNALAPHGLDLTIRTVPHFGYRYDPPVDAPGLQDYSAATFR